MRNYNNQWGNHDKRVANAIKMIEKYSSDWEYVGGYTDSEGCVIVRHKPCGYTTKMSYSTMKHNHGTNCWLCNYLARMEKKNQAKKKHELYKERLRIRNIKFKVYKFSECCVCGAFFIPEKRESICSDECRRSKLNHHYSMKKEERRKKAWTPESNQINVRSLFKRDNGICWLCGEMCDIDADPNDNRYPSVDHVIPIARGGLDEWNNVRLAHRQCNSVKWAHIIEDPDAVLTSLRSD